MGLDHFFKNQKLLLHNKTPEEVLRQAAELVADRAAYFPQYMAVDAQGNSVRPRSADAVAWSLEGALARVSNPWGLCPPGILKYLDSHLPEYIRHYMPGTDPQRFTDFGAWGEYASHEHALKFLATARTRLLRGEVWLTI